MKYNQCVTCNEKFNSYNEVFQHVNQTEHETYFEVDMSIGNLFTTIGCCLLFIGILVSSYAFMFTFSDNSPFSIFGDIILTSAIGFVGIGTILKHKSKNLQFRIISKRLK